MDILSDVNITGSLTTSGDIMAGNLILENRNKVFSIKDNDECMITIGKTNNGDYGIHINTINDYCAFENLVMLTQNTNVFCKQVWLYGGAYEETKLGKHPMEFSYYVRKINKTIQVPLTCSKFLIEENIPPHDRCSQSFPVIQSVGTYSKRSVSMDYEFCGNSSVYGIISTGGCRETEFAFQILVS